MAIRAMSLWTPDSELITATTVTAGNVGDAQAADVLLAEELAGAGDPPTEDDSPIATEVPLLSV
jgi:hypothetical protein